MPKLVRALYADAPVSLDRKQERADRILAAEEPRRKPGPPSTFASEEEKREHYRKSGREQQRRYMEKKRRRDRPSPADLKWTDTFAVASPTHAQAQQRHEVPAERRKFGREVNADIEALT